MSQRTNEIWLFVALPHPVVYSRQDRGKMQVDQAVTEPKAEPDQAQPVAAGPTPTKETGPDVAKKEATSTDTSAPTSDSAATQAAPAAGGGTAPAACGDTAVAPETIATPATTTSTTATDSATSANTTPAAATTPTSATDSSSAPAGAKPEQAKEATATTPSAAKKFRPETDLSSLPTRQYLDTTVVPILLQALSQLAKERPASPIEFVANYLLQNKSHYEGGSQQAIDK
ncbi:hypothetical protein BIW11_03726 [Tropilaelaps mercedesae]|uniref:Protein dpy-30-like n=1 Tax=Tropilaelaps mercedesae TaxID=418985 RepID=A0A1V9XGZ2_9ACAR|nr:hypothetical protein BIW11_03726 [Tropilaelaps mercedesae]